MCEKRFGPLWVRLQPDSAEESSGCDRRKSPWESPTYRKPDKSGRAGADHAFLLHLTIHLPAIRYPLLPKACQLFQQYPACSGVDGIFGHARSFAG